jgi:hypothetical protein
MKKTYRIICFLVCLGTGNIFAQTLTSTNFSNWTNGKPDGWAGTKTHTNTDFSISQETSGAVYGTSAVKLQNTATSHRRFTSQPLSVTNGQAYEIKLWVKGSGDFRTGLFDARDGEQQPSYGYFYNTYISSTSSWTMYTQQVTALNTHSQAEFIVSVASGATIEIDSIVVSQVNASVPEVSIYDIQYTTASSGDSPYKDEIVKTGGIVTAVHSTGYFLQSGTGSWRGVFVFDSNNTPARGDSVVLTGKVVEHFNMTQISNVTGYDKKSSGNTLPAAKEITTAEANTEPYESVLIKVKNAKCTNENAGFGMWLVNDNSGETRIHNMLYTFAPTINTFYDITGPVFFSYSEFKIEPRDAADITVSTSTQIEKMNYASVKVFPNPAKDILYINTKGSSETMSIELYDLSGNKLYSAATTDPSEVHTVNISNFSKGIYFVNLKGNGINKTARLIIAE